MHLFLNFLTNNYLRHLDDLKIIEGHCHHNNSIEFVSMFKLANQSLVYVRRVMPSVYGSKSQKMALLHGQNSTKQCLVETTQIITRTHSSQQSRE